MPHMTTFDELLLERDTARVRLAELEAEVARLEALRSGRWPQKPRHPAEEAIEETYNTEKVQPRMRIAELEHALKVARPYVNCFAEHGPSQRTKAGAAEDLKIVEAALRPQ